MAKKDNENKIIATDILSLVGGKENVSTIAHCMTRLRLTLKDESKIDIEAMKIRLSKAIVGLQSMLIAFLRKCESHNDGQNYYIQGG